MRRIVEGREFREKADSQGAFAQYQDPAAFAKTIAQELAYWGALIRNAGIAGQQLRSAVQRRPADGAGTRRRQQETAGRVTSSG